MPEYSIVRTLEADVKFCGSVGLHILKGFAGECKSSAQRYKIKAVVSIQPRWNVEASQGVK